MKHETSFKQPPFHDLQLIRKRALARMLCVNSWTIDRWRKDESFPKPIWLSNSTPAWKLSDIEAWLESRERGGAAPDWMPRRKSGKR
jgi:predicted DNA-binding transcriptional regulator AlpA